MRHVVVVFAAFIALAFGALSFFDSAPALPLAQSLGGQSVAPHRFPTGYDEFQADGDFWPPDQFRADNGAIVLFLNVVGVAKFCGVPAAENHAIIGCVFKTKDGTPIMVLPNPCVMQADDFYAGVSCHELAHINGWTHADTPRAAPPPPDPTSDPSSIALLGHR